MAGPLAFLRSLFDSVRDPASRSDGPEPTSRSDAPAPTTALTAAIVLVGGVVVWLVATRVFPYHSINHDEGVYLQQAAMLLDGRLFLRPPVEDVFRPWFFVVDGDRLYPKYAPVSAGIFAIGRLLGAFRLALVGVAVALLVLVAGVAREAFDRRTAPLAAAFLLASPLFVVDASVFLPYAPTTMLNLTFAYAYLRADRTGDRRWAGVAGAAVGLAFFSRPYTAVLFAAPFICHACWRLRTDLGPVVRERRLTATAARLAVTAALGLVGVTVALGYNAVVTGSPLVFPYQAFAPLDGLGFGQRRLLEHDVVYTLELALRSNRQAVTLFVTEWVAGGVFGTAVAALGMVVAARRGLDARQAAVAGVAPAVVAGNVYFWGTFNILGDLDRSGDGLVNALGPYYHFDLLVPFAVFAAVGALALLDGTRAVTERVVASRVGAAESDGGPSGPRSDIARRLPAAAVAIVAVVALVTLGGVAVGDVDHRLSENQQITDSYERAYEPFDGGAPANSLTFIPDPYGDWLGHPFQALRNDPGYDGRALYAIDERVFEVADTFPDRDLYRYAYRGAWAPYDGSPDGAHLQRVRDVSGPRVDLSATVGVPDDAVAVTARLGTEDGSLYRVPTNFSGEVTVDVTVANGTVGFAERDGGTNTGADTSGNTSDSAPDRFRIDDRENVLLTVFVDTGGGTGFTYRFDLPVQTGEDGTRALTPRVERCRAAHTCGGAAAHIPALAPDGVFVRTDLTARERNS